MGRRVLATVGAVLGVLGLLAGVAALALPWARYRVRGNVFGAGGLTRDGAWQVYQLDFGEVYVVALLLLAGLLAAGGLAGGPARTVTGIVAPALLGFGAGFLAVGRTPGGPVGPEPPG